MNLRYIIAGVVVIALVGGAYYFGYIQGKPDVAADNTATSTPMGIQQQQRQPEEQKVLADVGYLCDGGKTVHAVYLEGKVIIELSDGRAAQLHATAEEDGAMYRTADGTLVFFSEGPTAYVEEAGERAYERCLELDTDGVETL